MKSIDRVIVEDVTNSETFSVQASREALIEAGVRAVISVPLKSSAEHLLGMVSIHFDDPHRPEERELRFLDLLARQTSDYLQRKQAEEKEKILLHELQHRSNNLLAVVQAIASRSLSGDQPLAQARNAFEARLQALARANRRLTQSSRVGLNLGDLVRLELEPFTERTRIHGVDVMLGAQKAHNFALALHELATNAAKYGALANGSGKIDVSWTIAREGKDDVLKFKWQERGGPLVVAPARQGFGTALLKAMFADVRLEYSIAGLSCEFDVLLERAALGASEAPAELR